MRIDFLHCHGSGNDFPMVDAREMGDVDWPVVARALADRRGPVGGDGLLLLTGGDGVHHLGMRMFNSDGSEAELCLNGLRCIGRWGLDAIGADEARVKLPTASVGVARAAPIAPGVATIRETAGPASLDSAAWPLGIASARLVDAPLPPIGSGRRFTAVAMPNPHLVAFVDAVDDAELAALGAVCEAAPAWLPNRANVSFVEVRGPATLFVRTCERGVGLTDSCGSAMAASTYAACLTGRMPWGDELTVLNRGGLVRAAADEDGMVTVAGNATWQWAGSAEIDLLRGLAGNVRVDRHFNDEVAAWAAVAESVTASRRPAYRVARGDAATWADGHGSAIERNDG